MVAVDGRSRTIMSGAGRRTSYRKGVTKKVLYGDPEPKENEEIVRVISLRGSNIFEVVHADGSKSLTMLPQRFRKLIWVKRGDFLIVSSGEADVTVKDGKKGAVTSMVEHILYKDQIKNLQKKNLWPEGFDGADDDVKDTEDAAEAVEETENALEDKAAALTLDVTANSSPEKSKPSTKADTSKGIDMLPMYSDSFMMNRNRRKGVFESDEEESSDDEE
ncbi:TPA: hypothetical protein N0F65_010076 [Lagenidium giganteum]|uniref:S1-like domain-containing protein n=1 Tax=Lagenidium giganteum TaxID=4803 RepID=A0AAV2ZF04_9STRA|nr:TPA: hypothetical protein N0F65_010076 [Lagenidium giganteum]